MTITNRMTVACCMALLLASGENGIAAERAGTTGKAPAPVPDDRLLPLGFQVADCPTLGQVLKRFHEYHHQESEKIRNANYNLFAAWGLAADYEITKKKPYLDRATEFALHAIGKTGSGRQLPSGGWSDRHNQAIWYHAIILRGLATLLSVMPDDHPHRTEIQNATYKALNHLRSRQTATGGWLQRPGDEVGEVLAHPLHALGVITIRLDWPVADSLDLAAKGVIDPERKVSPENRNDEVRGQYIMAMGSLLRAYKHIKPAEGSNTPPPPAAHSPGREIPGPGPAQ